MIILGVETSCDETALALIETKENEGIIEYRVIQSLVHSQAELHSAYGGVYPTLAKREHGKNLVPLLHKLLIQSKEFLSGSPENISDDEFVSSLKLFETEIAPQNPELYQSFKDAPFLREKLHIDRIAVTEGPGLEPALWVGINFARMLGELWDTSVVPINHMEGHVMASFIEETSLPASWTPMKHVEFPALAFLISGGHTELVEVINNSTSSYNLKYKLLGQTTDDAVGEAFDKSARLLGLPYPGGSHISFMASKAKDAGIVPKFKLPRPMINSGDLNFSFSGLKTAVLYSVRANSDSEGKISENFKLEMALEFENAISDTLDSKLRKAIEQSGAKSVIIGGGVSANRRLRETFKKTCDEYGISLHLPSMHLSGDNALMIALAGAFKENSKKMDIKADGTKKLC